MKRREPKGRSERNSFKGIAANLQLQIESGEFQVGKYLPTEKDLQKSFGVSRTTIRRALSLLISQGWAQSVPSKGVIAGTGIKKAESKTVALIHAQTYVLDVMTIRLSAMLRDRGYHLAHLAGDKSSSIEEMLSHAAESGFAGALVWPFRGFPDPDVIGAVARSLPIVALDHKLHGLNTDLVSFDYFEAGYSATTQLLQQGRKRVGVTGMFDMLSTTHDRFCGYMKALFDAGQCPDCRDYVFSMTSGMEAVDTHNLDVRLSEQDRPDALFVLQDEYLSSTIQAVLGAGLRVPDDVAIASIGDDFEIEVDGIAQTSVVLDWETMAEEAVNLLLDRIEDPARVPIKRFAPQALVVRGLCGAPPEEWSATQNNLTPFRGELPYPRSHFRFETRRSVRSASGTASQRRGKSQ